MVKVREIDKGLYAVDEDIDTPIEFILYARASIDDGIPTELLDKYIKAVFHRRVT